MTEVKSLLPSNITFSATMQGVNVTLIDQDFTYRAQLDGSGGLIAKAKSHFMLIR